MDSYSVLLACASNVSNSAFLNENFNFKHFFLVLKTPFLRHFISTCFKHAEFRVFELGFRFKHFFTVLYTPFLQHSILNHHAQSFHAIVSKKLESYSVVLGRASNVPNSNFSNQGFDLITFILFYTLCFFDILFQIIMPNHSPQKFRKRWTITRFYQHVLKTSRIRGFRIRVFHFKHLFTVLKTPFLQHSILNHPA